MKKFEKILTLVQLHLMFIMLAVPLIHVITHKDSVWIVEKKVHHHHQTTKYVNKCEVFSEKALMRYMKKINIKFPEVVFQQAKLESGWFKSNVFKKNNNLFGMKKAMQRSTLSIGEPGEYAYFKTWKESVIDYALYQVRFFPKVKTKEAYIDALCKNYAENVNYKNLITELCATK